MMVLSPIQLLTSIGDETNIIVYGVGGYKFSDFLRIGVPRSIINWLIASMIIPLF